MNEHRFHIEISLSRQNLVLRSGNRVLHTWPVSTARNGPGEHRDSECTPRGRHQICDKIGDGCPLNTVFVAREPTGELYTPELRAQYPGRDWILTRILRIQGMEEGVNRGGEVDSYRRMIYIHGAPDDVKMGIPGSHGCIRMRNSDIVELFGMVEPGTGVSIRE